MSRRFFIDADLREGAALELGRGEYADEIKHMRKSLRLQAGDAIVFVNGRGVEAHATLDSLGADSARATVTELRRLERARPEITLAQGLLKGQRMDWIIEKAVEMEIARVAAVVTQHSVPSEQEAAGRSGRWQRLARSALKQSAAPFLPDIVGPLELAAFLAQLPENTRKILLHPDPAHPPLLRVLQESAGDGQQTSPICLLVGPEGGFHAEEVVELKRAGFRGASMGTAILRGETAGVVALAVAKQWAIAHNYG